MKNPRKLSIQIASHVFSGSVECSWFQMPNGYALMMNSDETDFYWLREDGEYSLFNDDEQVVCQSAFLDFKEHKTNA